MRLPQQPVCGSSLASISPQAPVLQAGLWQLVLLWLYFFPGTKFVKSISSDSGIRITCSSYCLSTGNYTACSVWSNPIVPLSAHSTQSVSSGWAFFSLLFFSSWIQRTAVLAPRRSYLDCWTYSSRSSIPSHHLHLQSDPASFERHGTTDQERKDYHQSRSIYLPFLSWNLLFPMASLHIDQVALVDTVIIIIFCWCSFD